ncbi:MAG TPA: DUF4846 domain-containing protein [Hyphomicrobiaceae bacterium]|nr:DUF4846 domain-containing protein [Hyphomicrobiaceae bacterium]
MSLCSRRHLLTSLAAAAVFPVESLRTASARITTGATVGTRFPAPAGYVRTPASESSFAGWLQRLPLLPDGAPVLLHTGASKARQDLHAAVIDIDIGPRDLQQCADAVMRLRAEWLFATGRHDEIAFNDTGGGGPMRWSRWAAGERPVPHANRLVWSKRAPADNSRASFRRYLDTVFSWAGTYSLERELVPVPARDIEVGDVVIKGGFPGHAVLVVDAVHAVGDGERRVLLAQSYMPAQSIHILKNTGEPALSPWYHIRDGSPVPTPEWDFPAGTLRRWR